MSSLKNYLQRMKGHGTEAILTRKVVSTFLINVTGTALGFGVHVFLARILGAGEYGKYAFALTWISVLVILGKVGLDTASLRLIPEYAASKNWSLLRGFVGRSFSTVTAVSVVIALAALVIAILLKDDLEPGLVEVFSVAAAVLPLSSLLILQCAYLQAFQHVSLSQTPQLIVRPLLLTLLIVIVASASHDAVSAFDAMAAYLLATGATMFVVKTTARRILPKEFFLGPQSRVNQAWTNVAFPMLLITTFNTLLNQTDIIMVGTLLSSKEAGVYAAVNRITTFIQFAIVMVNSVTAPVIAQLYSQAKFEQLQRMMTRVAWGSLIISLPVFLTTVLGANHLLSIFGPEFDDGMRALVILAFARLVVALTGSVGYLLSMSNHQKEAASILGVASLMNIGLCALLVPILGMDGAALSALFSTVLWCTYMVVLTKRLTGINVTIFVGAKCERS